MNTKESQNTATLQNWYDNMWGQCNADLIPSITAETYFRHDATGANNRVTGEQYRAMVIAAAGGDEVSDFTYTLIADGDFVASLGCYIRQHDGPVQWDWVQLFRLENAKLAETWLPGMGGNDPRAVPKPEQAWVGGEVPSSSRETESEAKQFMRSYFESLAKGADVTSFFGESILWHDQLGTNVALDPASLQSRLRGLMQNDTAQELELFLIEQDDLLVATGTWLLGSDQRKWAWVHAFRLEDGKIVEGWLPSIGGTDTSLTQSPDNLWNHKMMPAGSKRFGTQVQ